MRTMAMAGEHNATVMTEKLENDRRILDFPPNTFLQTCLQTCQTC
jgi:hypothetical protein